MTVAGAAPEGLFGGSDCDGHALRGAMIGEGRRGQRKTAPPFRKEGERMDHPESSERLKAMPWADVTYLYTPPLFFVSVDSKGR